MAPGDETAAPRSSLERDQPVKSVLLRGVFWRILIIEAILLVWSLGVRVYAMEGDWESLGWYALRIIILVAIILLFMMVTLSRFLTRRIIAPLEAIDKANLHLLRNGDDPQGRDVTLGDDAPREMKQIVASRHRMLTTILEASEQRLKLVEFIRDTFGRYVSQEVVKEILEKPEGLKLGGKRAEVSILFSDLRGFTSISDARSPEEIVRLLNRYLACMSDVILSYGGMIDEFIGDAILAVFGAPEPRPDDSARAVACAIAMQNALLELNQDLEAEGGRPLEMGIAVESGTVVLGNLGSEKRMKYGIVGAVVNQASRIESITVGGQVLMGQGAYQRVKALVEVGQKQSMAMKGLHEPLVSYPVLGIGPPFGLRLLAMRQEGACIDLNLKFHFRVLEGKTISEKTGRGEIASLGESDLLARIEPPLPALTDILMEFSLPAPHGKVGEVYAKVVGKTQRGREELTRLRVTSMHQKDRSAIRRLLSAGREASQDRQRRFSFTRDQEE